MKTEENSIMIEHTQHPVPPDQTAGPEPLSSDPSSAGLAKEDSAEAHAPRPVGKHRHKGKIARLPKEIRDQLSQMMLDGVPYPEIKSRLGEHAKDLSIKNISNWKIFGGLDDYVAEQDRLHDCRLRHELLEKMATQDTGTANYQASPKLAVAIISEALIDLGPEALRKGLQEDPRNAYRLLNSLARLLSGGLRCEQHLLDAAERKAQLEQAEDADHGKGLTPKVTGKLIHKLNLM